MSPETSAGSLQAAELLATGELTVLGRIMPASNHTYLCRLGDEPDGPQAVYKPISGERPLWDFEDGTLAAREYAAWLVSEALGWSVVPPTLLREGPSGPGMVQLWCEPDPEQNPIDIVEHGAVPPGMLHVVDATDNHDRPVMLVHEDSVALRRMAVFDLVANNTDRKGGHVLAMPDGHRYGVDHGVCFHVDDKLRTVLWGWAGQPLTDDETSALNQLQAAFDDGPLAELDQLITVDEVAGGRRRGARRRPGVAGAAPRRRAPRLLRASAFPDPGPGWPSLPWPAF